MNSLFLLAKGHISGKVKKVKVALEQATKVQMENFLFRLVFLVLTGRHLLWPNTTDETYSIIIVVVVVIVIMIIIITIIKLLGRPFRPCCTVTIFIYCA